MKPRGVNLRLSVFIAMYKSGNFECVLKEADIYGQAMNSDLSSQVSRMRDYSGSSVYV